GLAVRLEGGGVRCWASFVWLAGIPRVDQRGRCWADADAVFLDAASDCLFLAVPRLHRFLHSGATGGRGPPVQRYARQAFVRPSYYLLGAGRLPSFVDGSPGINRGQITA